jgi:hypothetical protein
VTIDAVLRVEKPPAVRGCVIDALPFGWTGLSGKQYRK